MAMPFDAAHRRRTFEALVLQGIWMIMRLVVLGGRYGHTVDMWRGNAIGYLDAIDQDPGDVEARKQYRRDTTFPELPR